MIAIEIVRVILRSVWMTIQNEMIRILQKVEMTTSVILTRAAEVAAMITVKEILIFHHGATILHRVAQNQVLLLVVLAKIDIQIVPLRLIIAAVEAVVLMTQEIVVAANHVIMILSQTLDTIGHQSLQILRHGILIPATRHLETLVQAICGLENHRHNKIMVHHGPEIIQMIIETIALQVVIVKHPLNIIQWTQ